ncbi:MAG: peptidoglycan-binding domain-containing protein [Rickettsiales bacterium]
MGLKIGEGSFSYSEKTLELFEKARKNPNGFNLAAAKLSAGIDAFEHDEDGVAQELVNMTPQAFGERLAANTVPGMESPNSELTVASTSTSQATSSPAKVAEPEGNIITRGLSAVGSLVFAGILGRSAEAHSASEDTVVNTRSSNSMPASGSASATSPHSITLPELTGHSQQPDLLSKYMPFTLPAKPEAAVAESPALTSAKERAAQYKIAADEQPELPPSAVFTQSFTGGDIEEAKREAAKYGIVPLQAREPETIPTPRVAATETRTIPEVLTRSAVPAALAVAPEEPTGLDKLITQLEKAKEDKTLPLLKAKKGFDERNIPLQQALAELGLLKEGLEGRPDDGRFGNATYAAVRDIQLEARQDEVAAGKKPTIAVDGEVGKVTWGLILDKLKEKQAHQPAQQTAQLGEMTPPPVTSAQLNSGTTTSLG